MCVFTYNNLCPVALLVVSQNICPILDFASTYLELLCHVNSILWKEKALIEHKSFSFYSCKGKGLVLRNMVGRVSTTIKYSNPFLEVSDSPKTSSKEIVQMHSPFIHQSFQYLCPDKYFDC